MPSRSVDSDATAPSPGAASCIVAPPEPIVPTRSLWTPSAACAQYPPPRRSSLASSAPDSTFRVRVGRCIDAKKASTSGLARSPRAMAARTPPVRPMLSGGVAVVTSCERSVARIAATASALARDSCFDFTDPGAHPCASSVHSYTVKAALPEPPSSTAPRKSSMASNPSSS